MRRDRAAWAFAFLCLSASAADAEYCSMMGCRGDIGYVFLPADGRYYGKFKYGDYECSLPDDYDPFGGNRLPAVSSVVSIKSFTSFYDETELTRKIDQFRPLDVEKIVPGKKCAASWAQPDGGMQINSSTQVRILGYRTFIGHIRTIREKRTDVYERQLLFALIQVVKD
jgi:hypothetical protein